MSALENVLKEISYNKIDKDNVKCGVCGTSIVFDAKNKYYACLGRKKSQCDQGYINQAALEGDLKILVAELQRVTRKSQGIKELKATLRKYRRQLINQIDQYDRRLAKLAKYILLVDESKPLMTLRFEVDETRDENKAQTKFRKHLDATIELYNGISSLSSLSKEYEDVFCPATRIFKKMSIKDRRIAELELMPGIDYLVQLARSDNYYAGQAKINHDKSFLEMELNNLLDELGADFMESCIYFHRRPSLKTLKRRDRDWPEQEQDELLLKELHKSGLLKRAMDRIEHPTERESAIDYASSFIRAPSLYDSGGPLVIKPENAMKVLEYQLKELNWLIKKQPRLEDPYYDWEDQTRHLIGKIFGFESGLYAGFQKKVVFLRLALGGGSKRIKLFREDQNEKREYLEMLIAYLKVNDDKMTRLC